MPTIFYLFYSNFFVDIDTMRYNSIMNAIPQKWRREIKQSTHEEPYVYKVNKLLQQKKPTKYIYNELIAVKCTDQENIILMWQRELPEYTQDDVDEAFHSIYITSI